MKKQAHKNCIFWFGCFGCNDKQTSQVYSATNKSNVSEQNLSFVFVTLHDTLINQMLYSCIWYFSWANAWRKQTLLLCWLLKERKQCFVEWRKGLMIRKVINNWGLKQALTSNPAAKKETILITILYVLPPTNCLFVDEMLPVEVEMNSALIRENVSVTRVDSPGQIFGGCARYGSRPRLQLPLLFVQQYLDRYMWQGQRDPMCTQTKDNNKWNGRKWRNFTIDVSTG